MFATSFIPIQMLVNWMPFFVFPFYFTLFSSKSSYSLTHPLQTGLTILRNLVPQYYIPLEQVKLHFWTHKMSMFCNCITTHKCVCFQQTSVFFFLTSQQHRIGYKGFCDCFQVLGQTFQHFRLQRTRKDFRALAIFSSSKCFYSRKSIKSAPILVKNTSAWSVMT